MFPRLFPHSLAACGHKYGRGASGAGVGAVANWLHHVETSHAPAHRQTERHRKTIRWTPSLLRLSFDAKTGTQCHVASAVVSSRAADWVVFSIMEWPHAARNAIRCNLYDGGDDEMILNLRAQLRQKGLFDLKLGQMLFFSRQPNARYRETLDDKTDKAFNCSWTTFYACDRTALCTENTPKCFPSHLV